MKLRTKLARVLVGVTAAVSMVPASVGVLGGVALAGTCSSTDVDVSTFLTSKAAFFTHDFELATLGPGGTATETLSWATSYTSTVTGTGSAKFTAGAILATAETTFSLSLADANTTTYTKSVSLSQLNSTSSYHRYIFFRGVTIVKGTWKEYHCYAGVEKVAYQGNWGSWMLQHSGAVRCDDDATLLSKYGSASLEYQAAIKC
ncbi:MAG: hypothetical protein ABIR11_02280 [Candidatus Limnocylindrales bacterium]